MGQFCERLEDTNHRGNSQYLKIYRGSYPGTSIAYAKFIDAQALLKGFDQFPEDLKNTVFEKVNKLKTLMSYPLNSKTYTTKFLSLSKQINNDINKMQYSDLVTKSKYENHPNWKGIQKSFLYAKQSVLKVFETSKISSDMKKYIMKRIQKTRIIFPMQFENSKRVRKIVDTKCNQDMVNLFYLYDLNSVMVCSGFFNTYQNIHSNVLLLAHEVAHSIDPRSLANSFFSKSVTGEVLTTLRENGDSKSCDTWKTDKINMRNSNSEVISYHNPYRKLLSCIGSKYLGSSLKKNDSIEIAQNLYKGESRILNQSIIESTSHFSKATKLAMNQRLDESYTLKYTGKVEALFNNQFDLAYIVKKEMACGMSYKAATLSARSIYINSKLQKMKYCKEDCLVFADNEKTKESVEILSDIIAQKAMVVFLENLSSKYNKLEVMQSSLALFCPRKNSVSKYINSINFLIFEQSPNRNYLKTKERRLMPFTKSMSNILQCGYKQIKNNPLNCSI